MVGIIKGDCRFDYLNKIIDDSIISNELKDFYNIDVLVLPFLGIKGDYIISGTDIDIRDILKNNSIRLIITGKDKFGLLSSFNIKVIELLHDEYFQALNGKLTAEGFINYFQNRFGSLLKYSYTIMGYGNIGVNLCKILDSLGASFSVVTNNLEERKQLILNNKCISDDIYKNDIIINTIPCVYKYDINRLKSIKIFDLASPPYGFDVVDMDKYDIDYEICGAIPSKFDAMYAAIIIKKIIENVD